MKIDEETKTEVKNIKLKNYKEFVDTVNSSQEQEIKRKIQETADYIAHIKIHDEEAYKNYLSYSTYLKL
ncbi:MAG: hypothetical protein ACI9TV_002706 [Sulfurimonas sp.]|jgi:hypothetical protein|uniref:hypothetical protein n=1 Tax=Sulfurimonas sp. TaxID=2022749 RepID=UPI0039E213E8